MTTTWEGDWKTRIQEIVKKRGFQDLIEFSEKNLDVGFFRLKEILGDQIAPIQIEQMLSEAYYERNQYTRFFRGSLARHIRDSIPKGWEIGEGTELKAFWAFSDWKNRTPDEYTDFTERVWEVLKSSKDIPTGWRPNGPDDPIILKIFEKAGFQEVEITSVLDKN